MLKRIMPLLPELAVIIFGVVGSVAALFQLGAKDLGAVIVLLVCVILAIGAFIFLRKRISA